MEEAKMWLEIAIRRHERHMTGQEPANEISQNLLMEEIKYALEFLNDGSVVTTTWYDRNIKKYPDSEGGAHG